MGNAQRQPGERHDPIIRVREQLTAIPELYTQAAMHRQPGSTPPDPDQRRATSNPSRPTVRLDVVDLLDERNKTRADDETGQRDPELDKLAGYRRLGVLPTLGLWVAMVQVELEDSGQQVAVCCPTRTHTAAGECSWLLTHAETVLELHRDFAKDVDWIYQDLLRACGVRPDHPVSCRACGDRVEGHDKNAWFQCVGCGRSWLFDAEMARIGKAAAGDGLGLTLRQMAVELGLAESTLYKLWKLRRVLPQGVGVRGVRLFQVEHVRRAAEKYGLVVRQA